jgi:hypothetical protein
MNTTNKLFDPRYMRARLLAGLGLHPFIFISSINPFGVGGVKNGFLDDPIFHIGSITILASLAVIFLIPVVLRGTPAQKPKAVLLLILPVIFTFCGWLSAIEVFRLHFN